MPSKLTSTSTSSANPQSTSQPSRQTWLAFFDKSLLIIGAIAVILALVFFIAYNWSDMGKMGKFALVEGSLIASIVGYILLAYKRRYKFAQQLLLFIASVATGSLLALFGQVYQTGADTWQLFFNWALFITPWVLIARMPSLWLLWLGLLNLVLMLSANTAGFWFATHGFVGLDIETVWLITSALLNMAALALWLAFMPYRTQADSLNAEYNALHNADHKAEQPALNQSVPEHKGIEEDTRLHNRLLNTEYHWSTYVVGAVATFYATRLGMFIVLDYGDIVSNIVTLLLWAGFVRYMYWRFRVKHIDILMLTYLCGSIVSVVMVWASDLLLRDFDAFGIMLLAILLTGISATAVTWLRSVIKIKNKSLENYHSQPPSDAVATAQTANTETDNDDATPWYLHLFLGFSGLISGALITGVIVLLFNELLDSPITQAIIGFVLLAIAIITFKQNPQYHSQLERHTPNQDPTQPHHQSSNQSSKTFVQSIAYSFSIAGQLFLGYAIFNALDSEPLRTVTFLSLQLLLFVIVRDFLHRLYNSVNALGCVIWLLAYYNAPEASAALLALVLCVFSLQSTEFLQFMTPAKRSRALALFKPVGYASMLLLLVISVLFISAEYSPDIANTANGFYYHYPLAQGLLIAVSLYATHILLRRYHSGLNSRTGIIIASAVVVLGILSVYVSGLLATCLVIVIAMANQQKRIMALALVALVGYVFWYYYQLDTTLLVKSLSMLSVGIAVLLIRWLLVSKYFAKHTGLTPSNIKEASQESSQQSSQANDQLTTHTPSNDKEQG